MTNTPIVSIIIPTYKRDGFLKIAIDSALKQEYTNIEIIVSDDAASTSTRDLVYSFNDSRLKYFSNCTNLGVVCNIVAGFNKAEGEYAAFLCDDDFWELNFLQKLVSTLNNNPDIVVAFSDHNWVDGNGNILQKLTDENSMKYKRDLLSEGVYRPFRQLVVDQSIPMVMAAVFRKSAISLSQLPKQAGPAYDVWISYLLCKTELGAYYCPERLTNYRTHSGQLSTGDVAWSMGSASFWLEILSDTDFSEYKNMARRKASLSFTGAAIQSLRLGHLSNARKYARQGLQFRLTGRGLAAYTLGYLPSALVRRIVSRRN